MVLAALRTSQRTLNHESPAVVRDGLLLHQPRPSSSTASPTTILRAFGTHQTTETNASSSFSTPLRSQGMSQLARSIQTAVRGPKPSSAWLRSYTDITMNRLHHLRPRQLSTIIRAMVALDYHPGEEWLCDFDTACFSHPGPFDTQSAVEVLASMAALPDVNFSFPQAVYIKLLADPSRFDDYGQLACLLHCLGSHNVPAWDESGFLDVVGMRMGKLLATMPKSEAQKAVSLSLCKSSTLAAILEIDADSCPAADDW